MTKKLLELFKGTGSVGRVFVANGYEVLSLDSQPRWHPDLCIDILTWDYRRDIQPHQFDVVWASPPCTEYSTALTTRPRNIRLANRIVQRTLEIIRYVKPSLWFMENPAKGFLRCQSFMRGIPFIDVDYCRFSRWGYRKRTRIWYGGSGARPLENQLCKGVGRCPNLDPKHPRRHRVQMGLHGMPNVARDLKYRIPAKLVAFLARLHVTPRDVQRHPS